MKSENVAFKCTHQLYDTINEDPQGDIHHICCMQHGPDERVISVLNHSIKQSFLLFRSMCHCRDWKVGEKSLLNTVTRPRLFKTR
jgi:hypothetical protein